MVSKRMGNTYTTEFQMNYLVDKVFDKKVDDL